MDDWIPYEVLSESDNRTAQVKFLNPFYSGDFITVEDVPDPENEGQTIEQEVDNDPNPHTVKTVNIPFKGDGTKDEELFQQWCKDQARGVLHRMKLNKR